MKKKIVDTWIHRMAFFRHTAHGAKTAAPVEATTVAEAANGHAATATLKPRRRCTKAAAAWQPAGRRVCMAGGVVQ